MRKILLILSLALPLLLPAAAVKPGDWSRAEKLYPGVLLLRCRLEKPRLMQICLMRVDLSRPGIRWIATERDPDWGKPMPDFPAKTICAKRLRTADFLMNARKPVKEGGRNLNVIIAANAAPWTPWEKPYTHKYSHPAGLNITDGQILSDTAGFGAVFLVTKAGQPAIVSAVARKDYGRIALAVSGFGLLLKDGKKVAPGGYQQALMPRMCYGLSKDKKYFYILTVDGRQKEWSLGAKMYEMAELLLQAGAYDAIDMDGGGSATLCCFDRKSRRPVMLNRQTAGGYARPVGSNIGIVLPGPVRR